MGPCLFLAQMCDEARSRQGQDNTEASELEDEFECEVCDQVNIIHKLKEESAECEACGMLNEEALEMIRSTKKEKLSVEVNDD